MQQHLEILMQGYKNKLYKHLFHALACGLLSFFLSIQLSFADTFQDKSKKMKDEIGLYLDSTMQALMRY